jgi:hypothetical protein
MSETGPTRKYSLGADVFRFPPESGHPTCGLGCRCVPEPDTMFGGTDDPAVRHLRVPSLKL